MMKVESGLAVLWVVLATALLLVISGCNEDGDGFFIYTDGLTEAADPHGRQFGLDRLAELLSNRFGLGARPELNSLSEEVVGEIDDFAGFTKQTDDITFIIARAYKATQSRGSEDL